MTADSRLPAPTTGVSGLLLGAGRGAVLGLAWGLAARIWMRAITDVPEFSWTGTLMILGFAAWLGLGSGLLAAARRGGRKPWWALLGAPGLLLFASPGMVMLPAFLFGGLAFSTHARPWRLIGWLAVATPTTLLVALSRNEPVTDDVLLFAIGGSVMLSVGLALLGAPLWTGRRRAES
ncbi:hypothetical protein IEZ26_16880 [Nocardioides cavernae]|uniref:Uncharacterized protein n=1 Tax=Nocardioides cavernae TaxID=1921566 RepID=A0ABR8NDU7_9ACTN|nr:hypothetical protein [Nocardioides cavernae]MBD3926303.1 hypothetical protein [Nocardioides cavernae]MBM7513896.1 hypothetical protein [Nocardioides cavernae]